MQDNRNAAFCRKPSQGIDISKCGGGTVCIDTNRVLDCCRDRDCYEDARVYLGPIGEAALSGSTNIRTRSAKILCANVSLEEVPFNNGFYRVVVRYYIETEFEACIGVGRSQTFKGLSVLDKDVVLYGGEGTAMSFTSNPENGLCAGCNLDNIGSNSPTAVVEAVNPIVLNTRVSECNCSCNCLPCECDIPETVKCAFCEDITQGTQGPRLLVSFGIFSVIRIIRPAQLLVQATDYSVPDKVCTPGTSSDSPCELFKSIAFPVSSFRGIECREEVNQSGDSSGGCGCSKR